MQKDKITVTALLIIKSWMRKCVFSTFKLSSTSCYFCNLMNHNKQAPLYVEVFLDVSDHAATGKHSINCIYMELFKTHSSPVPKLRVVTVQWSCWVEIMSSCVSKEAVKAKKRQYNLQGISSICCCWETKCRIFITDTRYEERSLICIYSFRYCSYSG